MPRVSCRACGNTKGRYIAIPARAFGETGFFECGSCKSLTLNQDPTPGEILETHAQGTYHGEKRKRFVGTIEKAVHFFRHSRARWIEKHLRSGARLLDVGCGRGQMARYLCRRGFRVAVTEISQEVLSGLADQTNLECHIGPDVLKTFSDQSFDGICFFHTLEHMAEPMQVLGQARRLLRDWGQVFLEIPLFSRLARKFGPHWFHLEVPQHLVNFSREGIQKAIDQAGLKIVETRFFSLEYSPASLFLSLTNRLLPRYPLYQAAHITHKNSFHRALVSVMILLGSLLCLLPSWFLAVMGQGDVFRARLILKNNEDGSAP